MPAGAGLVTFVPTRRMLCVHDDYSRISGRKGFQEDVLIKLADEWLPGRREIAGTTEMTRGVGTHLFDDCT